MFYVFVDHLEGRATDSEDQKMPAAGRKHEMTTDGGEVNFVMKIIQESKLYQTSIKIFTVMLGRKRSITELKQILKCDKDVKSVATSEFCQGRIMRWGLAWTFHPNICFGQTMPSKFAEVKQQKKQITPFVISLDKTEKLSNSIAVCNVISEMLVRDLKANGVSNEKIQEDECVIGFRLYKPLWRNQRLKRREQERLLEGPSNKKLRMDTSEDDAEKCEKLLDVLLTINTDNQEKATKIELNFICTDGLLGRSGLYELVQYFKNKLIVQ